MRPLPPAGIGLAQGVVLLVPVVAGCVRWLLGRGRCGGPPYLSRFSRESLFSTMNRSAGVSGPRNDLRREGVRADWRGGAVGQRRRVLCYTVGRPAVVGRAAARWTPFSLAPPKAQALCYMYHFFV